MKKYEELADEIALSIRNGVLFRGDKLPSIRQASSSRDISPSTVFQAYYLLEARGLITAREKSGYFVSGGPTGIPQLPEPKISSEPQLTQVDVSELVFDILDSIRARKLVPLGSAFPSPLLFPLKSLARSMASTIQSMDPWTTVRDLSPGDEGLRRQIALRYLIDGLNVTTDEIVITAGALEALNICLSAVTKPGDAVLVESPTFYAALQAIERSGLKAIEVPSHPRFGVDLEAMELAIKEHNPKACWLMTTFQNPLGSLMPEDRKKDLVALLTKHRIPLIEDDVYGELYFGDKRPLPAKAYDTEGWVMHCSSFSKCLAPGYRIGWVAPGRFSQAVERIKLTTTLAASVPAQQALGAYLAKGGYDRHLRGLRHNLLIQQIKFIEAIESYFPQGTKLSNPAGGYFLWVQLPKNVSALNVHRQGLTHGISVAPGPMFSAQRQFDNFIRLNCGHIWDCEMEKAISNLGKIIKLA